MSNDYDTDALQQPHTRPLPTRPGIEILPPPVAAPPLPPANPSALHPTQPIPADTDAVAMPGTRPAPTRPGIDIIPPLPRTADGPPRPTPHPVQPTPALADTATLEAVPPQPGPAHPTEMLLRTGDRGNLQLRHHHQRSTERRALESLPGPGVLTRQTTYKGYPAVQVQVTRKLSRAEALALLDPTFSAAAQRWLLNHVVEELRKAVIPGPLVKLISALEAATESEIDAAVHDYERRHGAARGRAQLKNGAPAYTTLQFTVVEPPSGAQFAVVFARFRIGG